jgi:hypothetical protein
MQCFHLQSRASSSKFIILGVLFHLHQRRASSSGTIILDVLGFANEASSDPLSSQTSSLRRRRWMHSPNNRQAGQANILVWWGVLQLLHRNTNLMKTNGSRVAGR